MPQLQCVRVRLKPGTTDRVVRFLRGLEERTEEVQESLAAEGIHFECLFLDRGKAADHLIFLTEADDLDAAARAFQESELPLDVETRRLIAETWEEVTPLEYVVALRARESPASAD